MSTYEEQLAVLEVNKARYSKTENIHILHQGLRSKLAEGNVTTQDIDVAAHVAKTLGSTSARVLYSSIKKAAQQEPAQEE